MTRTFVQAPSNRLQVELDGWLYGLPDGNTIGGSKIPDTLASVADMLRPLFRLPGMDAKSMQQKQEAFDAYGHDLDVLQGMLKALDATLDNAIGATLTFNDSSRTYEDKDKRKQELIALVNKACEHVPAGHTFELDSELAATDVTSIMLELRRRLDESLSNGLERLGLRLKALVDNECIGLCTWNAIDVCCYHFFVHEERDVSELKGVHEVDHGSMVEKVEERSVTRTMHHIRRVHHVVNAQLHNLDDYRGVIPERVRAFLVTVPPEVRNLLQVVDGRMTKQEEVVSLVEKETFVTHKTIGVYWNDPAITIGDFVLIGWDQNEIDVERTKRWVAFRKKVSNVTKGLVLLLVCISLIYGGWYWWSSHNAKKAQEAAAAQALLVDRYENFLRSIQGGDRIVTEKGDQLKLGVPLDIRYRGVSPIWKSTNKTEETSETEQYIVLDIGGRSQQIKCGFTPKGDAAYGTIDLASLVGLHSMLKVTSATEDRIEYVVIPTVAPEEKQTK